jgi:TetR/AcrR family transcriptional regulator
MSKPPNQELARRIRDIALEELGDKPPEKVNMRAIAEKAGVSPTAIYYYYASKDELFEQIKFDAMDELDQRLTAVDAIEGGAREKLAAFVRLFVSWCLERPNLARLLMDELPPKEALTEEGMRRYYAIFFRARDLLEKGIAEGALDARDLLLDISVAQAAIWGIVSQFESRRVHPRFWDSIDPLVDRFIEIFFGTKTKDGSK